MNCSTIPVMTDNTARVWPDIAGRFEGKHHVLPVRIYYEDTDFSGVVYHANYLRFCERGRSDMLRLAGAEHTGLAGDDDIAPPLAFAVVDMDISFFMPARIDDLIEVESAVMTVGGARIVLAQQVMRGADRLFSATVTVAVLDRSGRPRRLPGSITAPLSTLMPDP